MSDDGYEAMNVRLIVGGDEQLGQSANGLALDPDEDVIVGYVPGLMTRADVEREAERLGYPLREPLREFRGPPDRDAEFDELVAYTKRSVLRSLAGKMAGLDAATIDTAIRADPLYARFAATEEPVRRAAMSMALAQLVDEGRVVEDDGEGDDARYSILFGDEVAGDALTEDLRRLGVAIGDVTFLADGPVDLSGRYRGIPGVPAGEIRIASGRQLGTIMRVAEARNYNRQVPFEDVERLDPDGYHVLSAFMLHAHAQGQPCDVHVRAQGRLKVKGSASFDDAYECMIDVPIAIWGSLERRD